MTLDSTPDRRARIGEECGKWYSSPEWGRFKTRETAVADARWKVPGIVKRGTLR